MLQGRLEQWLALQRCRFPWEVVFCWTIQGQLFGRGIPEPPADPEPQGGEMQAFPEEGAGVSWLLADGTSWS